MCCFLHRAPPTLNSHKEGVLWFQDDLRKEMTETENGLRAELKVGRIVGKNVMLFTLHISYILSHCLMFDIKCICLISAQFFLYLRQHFMQPFTTFHPQNWASSQSPSPPQCKWHFKSYIPNCVNFHFRIGLSTYSVPATWRPTASSHIMEHQPTPSEVRLASETLLLSINLIPPFFLSDSINLETGKFTAPEKGVYRFTFTGNFHTPSEKGKTM